MSVSIIAALGKNNVIGSDNKLPWKLKADMKRFVSLTKGKTVIMGRKTFESIGKPLPNRTNIILTRDTNYKQEGCAIAHSMAEALKKADNKEVMIIGGANIYKQFLQVANKLYLTYIDHSFDGDVYFPIFDKKNWIEIEKEEHKKDLDNPYDYTFVTLERK